MDANLFMTINLCDLGQVYLIAVKITVINLFERFVLHRDLLDCILYKMLHLSIMMKPLFFIIDKMDLLSIISDKKFKKMNKKGYLRGKSSEQGDLATIFG